MMILALQLTICKTHTHGKKHSTHIHSSNFRVFSPEILRYRYVYIAQRQPEWLAMLTIFKYTTWILIVVLLILSTVAWYLLGRITQEKKAHKNVALVTMNSFSLFLGVTANNRPSLSPLRIFFLTLALYGINLTTIYTSKLINVFTNPPYDDQIDTISEIVDSHLPIGECFQEKKITQNSFNNLY